MTIVLSIKAKLSREREAEVSKIFFQCRVGTND